MSEAANTSAAPDDDVVLVEPARAQLLELAASDLVAAETARRGVARTERNIDDARVWLLVDSVVQAAGGLRRELSLPAPALRPAGAVAATAGARSARGAQTPAELDRLLALPHAHVIVDGHNVTVRRRGHGGVRRRGPPARPATCPARGARAVQRAGANTSGESGDLAAGKCGGTVGGPP